MKNIHPISDGILSTVEKENFLHQNSIVIWMVGLSGSGKSTLAKSLEKSLFEKGYYTMLLDGDNLRTGINNNLTFTPEDRLENIRRAAECSKLFALNGTITICSLISPTEKIRELARSIVGEKYFEVYIDCPIEECEKRDVKGLYAKARAGEIKDFTGISAPFEIPQNPNLVIDTYNLNILESLQKLVDEIMLKIKK